MSETISITLKRELMDVTKLKFVDGANAETCEKLVKGPSMKVELDVILPAAADKKAAEAAAEKFLDDYEAMLHKHLSEGLSSICKLYQENQKNENDEAFGTAEGILDKLNKHLERITDEFRVELRKAIAKKIKVDAKDLMTMGRSKFKEMRLLFGNFNNEVSFQPDGEVRSALKSKDWQNFAVAHINNTGAIHVSGTKKITPSLIKDLIKKAGKGAKVFEGMLRAKGLQNIRVELLKSSGAPGADLARKLISDALEAQAKAGKTTKVKVVDRYSDEEDEAVRKVNKAKEKEEKKEKGKGTEKEKEEKSGKKGSD